MVSRLLIILLVGAAACGGRLPEQSATNRDGVELIQLTDGPIDLSMFRGKVLFVNFWATWCAPCIREMPSIERVKATFGESDIHFLFASNESVEDIAAFAAQNPFSVQFVRVTNFEELNIPALPTTLIFDANGQLAYSESGFRMWDDPMSVELIKQIISKK